MEGDLILSKDADLIISEPVVGVVLLHREAKRLADHIVERHRQKVAPQQHEHHAEDPVELAPPSLLLENLIDLDCLTPLSNLDRKCLFLSLDVDLGLLLLIDLQPAYLHSLQLC